MTDPLVRIRSHGQYLTVSRLPFLRCPSWSEPSGLFPQHYSWTPTDLLKIRQVFKRKILVVRLHCRRSYSRYRQRPPPRGHTKKRKTTKHIKDVTYTKWTRTVKGSRRYSVVLEPPKFGVFTQGDVETSGLSPLVPHLSQHGGGFRDPLLDVPERVEDRGGPLGTVPVARLRDGPRGCRRRGPTDTGEQKNIPTVSNLNAGWDLSTTKVEV